MRWRSAIRAARGGRFRTRPTRRRSSTRPAADGRAGGGSLGGLPAFYSEGTLIWLDADVTIRRLTNGRKTLDDFCTLFHGQNDNGKVWMKPFDADEVYRTLNTVAAYDWHGFFEKRLQSKSADLPLGGVENGGFKLVYTDAPNMFTDPWSLDGSVNALGSLGIHVTADGMVDDGWPGAPAYAAGISNGMKIVAVNGRRFSADELRRAIAGVEQAGRPAGVHRGKCQLLQGGDRRLSRRPALPASRARRRAPTDLLTTIATRRVAQ